MKAVGRREFEPDRQQLISGPVLTASPRPADPNNFSLGTELRTGHLSEVYKPLSVRLGFLRPHSARICLQKLTRVLRVYTCHILHIQSMTSTRAR